MELNKLVDSYVGTENELIKIEEQKNSLLLATQVFDKIKALDEEAKKLADIKASVQEQLTIAMRENMYEVDGNTVFESEQVRLKYTPPTTRKSVDSNTLKATYPDVYKAVLKESAVKDRVTITYKGVE